jgi:hypothetical protein
MRFGAIKIYRLYLPTFVVTTQADNVSKIKISEP